MARGDHPIIVGVGLISAVVTIIAFITGRANLLDFFGLSGKSSVPTYAIVTKSPEELTKWLGAITDRMDRDEQRKTLYYGRRIRVSGNIKRRDRHGRDDETEDTRIYL